MVRMAGVARAAVVGVAAMEAARVAAARASQRRIGGGGGPHGAKSEQQGAMVAAVAVVVVAMGAATRVDGVSAELRIVSESFEDPTFQDPAFEDRSKITDWTRVTVWRQEGDWTNECTCLCGLWGDKVWVCYVGIRCGMRTNVSLPHSPHI